MLAEAEGIIAWAVAGAKLWHQSNLNKPPEVEAANIEWRAQMDQIGRFIEERCIVGDSFRVQASGLYADYKRWAESSGEQAITATAFGRKMADRFQKREETRGNAYIGIGLKMEPQN